MLFIFDLDGTLISSYMDNPDRKYHDWHVLPGRRERLAALLAERHAIALVTNQGGVAFGLVTQLEAEQKIAAALMQLGIPTALRYVCYADARSRIPAYADPAQVARRKPSGAMIREAMHDYPNDAHAGVLFIGDRPEDEAAARDAGVPFQWADTFFLP